MEKKKDSGDKVYTDNFNEELIIKIKHIIKKIMFILRILSRYDHSEDVIRYNVNAHTLLWTGIDTIYVYQNDLKYLFYADGRPSYFREGEWLSQLDELYREVIKKQDLHGFFHFFKDLNEFNDTYSKVLWYPGIRIGKFIVLSGQISTKEGKFIGTKGKRTYAFTSLFSDDETYQEIIKDGIIKKENFIETLSVSNNEFDNFSNLRKGETFVSIHEFQNYLKKMK